MSLVLDPAIEARLQRELAAGHYAEPSALLAHALDLVKGEREDILTRRAEIIADLEESRVPGAPFIRGFMRMSGFHAAADRSEASAEATNLPPSNEPQPPTPAAHPPQATHPRSRHQRELAAGHDAEPSNLLAHALDLIEAECSNNPFTRTV
jgi:hypothetical protein